jgi:hypothetical protein
MARTLDWFVWGWLAQNLRSAQKQYETRPATLMIKLVLLVFAAGLSSLAALAQDWPAWGGSDAGRNMYSASQGLPDSFEAGKTKAGGDEIDLATTRNVRWVAKLGSQSYGNAVVAGGKVYIGTNNESPRDKRHSGDRSILLCLDEKTGGLLWQLAPSSRPARPTTGKTWAFSRHPAW